MVIGEEPRGQLAHAIAVQITQRGHRGCEEVEMIAPQPLNSGAKEGETLYYDRAEVQPWFAAKMGINIDTAERLAES